MRSGAQGQSLGTGGEPRRGADWWPRPGPEVVPLPPPRAMPCAAIHCRPHHQPLCWAKEGGEGGHVMEVMGHSSDLGLKMPWDLTGFSITKRADLEQLFCLRVHVLAGGLLADSQSTDVFCRNFSNCIFSSRTQEPPDCADQSLGGAIRAQAPAAGPTEARLCPIRRVQTRGLRGLSHTLGCGKCLPDRRAPRHTGAGAMPATAEQRGPTGRQCGDTETLRGGRGRRRGRDLGATWAPVTLL